MIRGLAAGLVLSLAACGSSAPDAPQTAAPQAPTGVTGVTGPTGVEAVTPAAPTAAAAAPTPTQTQTRRSSQPRCLERHGIDPTQPPGANPAKLRRALHACGPPPAATAAPSAVERCMAEHGVSGSGVSPSPDDMTAALQACAPKAAAGAPAPSVPDSLKVCLERHRPANPSSGAAGRVIIKCTRKAARAAGGG
jgi:hypothetical protein